MAVACTSPHTGVLTWTRGGLGHGSALEPSTLMYAASVTKQLVGVLAAQQVLAARLHADDRIVDLLPTLPGWTDPIRVRHLLHHTSGLPTTARVMATVGVDNEQHLTSSLVLEGLGSLSAPDAPAGSAFVYSNIGYVVLAETLRALTSTSLPVLAQENAVRTARHDGQPPCSGRAADPADGRANSADGWRWRLVASASDLLTWLDALNRDRFGQDLTQLVQTPGHLDDGTALDYAWGVAARTGPTGTSYTHGGHWGG